MYNQYMPGAMTMNPSYSQIPNYMSRLDALQQTMPGQRMEIIKVNGRNGANAFGMPPNSQALLLDETAPIVWLKQTDGAGYASITPYSITPYQEAPALDLSSLEGRISRLEDIINAKPDASAAKSGTDKNVGTK